VLDRLLGDVDAAEDADQDGHRAAVFLTEHLFDFSRRNAGHAADQCPPLCCIGRTSIGSVVARASLRPHARAASRSAALTIVNPPMCSLPSAKGPSVVRSSPSFTRTTVAVLAGCSPAEKTQAPAAFISSRTT